jgi:hypothetical protein
VKAFAILALIGWRREPREPLLERLRDWRVRRHVRLAEVCRARAESLLSKRYPWEGGSFERAALRHEMKALRLSRALDVRAFASAGQPAAAVEMIGCVICGTDIPSARRGDPAGSGLYCPSCS